MRGKKRTRKGKQGGRSEKHGDWPKSNEKSPWEPRSQTFLLFFPLPFHAHEDIELHLHAHSSWLKTSHDSSVTAPHSQTLHDCTCSASATTSPKTSQSLLYPFLRVSSLSFFLFAIFHQSWPRSLVNIRVCLSLLHSCSSVYLSTSLLLTFPFVC